MSCALTLLMVAQDFPGASQPHVAVGPKGQAYVVVIHDRNIKVAASSDGGRSFGALAVAVDARGRAAGGMRRGPRIAVDKEGNPVVTVPVCFDGAEFKEQYPTPELWLARSPDGGQTWSKPLQVNEVPKQAGEALHWMATGDDGTVHIAWLDRREQKKNCLWYTRVKDNKVEKNRRLTGPVCECCAPGMALDAKGNPFIAVREGGVQRDRGVWLTFSKNGGRTFSPVALVNDAETNVDT